MRRRHSQGNQDFNPETLALGFGYNPELSEGSVKPPVFLTSTFQFKCADDGRRFFELAYGLRRPDPGEVPGLIYSRINNPNLEMFEERIAAWDKTEKAATFASGMAAIATTALALLRPGDVLITTSPVYGGSHYLFEKMLPRYGSRAIFVRGGIGAAERMREAAEQAGPEHVRMLFVETPANPSNELTDIAEISALARSLSAGRERPCVTVVDNTFLGPVFQRPALQGADIVLYSATKYIGGHSNLIAGVASGPASLMAPIMETRTIFGTMANPFTGWLLLRSLETLGVRMRRQAKSATKLAKLLAAHPAVTRVFYPGLLMEGDPQHTIYTRQCTGAGSLISFEVRGGRDAAYRVLDAFEVCRLAVSLGGTETLVEHPMTMTHSDVPPEELESFGVSEGLIRMSVGLEHLFDLEADLKHALSKV